MPTVLDICFNNVVIGGTGGALKASMYYYTKKAGQQLVTLHPEKTMVNQDLINILDQKMVQGPTGPRYTFNKSRTNITTQITEKTLV